MHIRDLMEHVSLVTGPVGHWDKQKRMWIGKRYVGYLPEHLLGNLTFEQHMQVLIKDKQQRQQLIDWGKNTKSQDLVKKIEMALNGFSSQMIATEMYTPSQMEQDPTKPVGSVNVQLSRARAQMNIPIPPSSMLKYQSVLQQALDLKRKLYRPDNPVRNSDRTVARLMVKQHVVDDERSVAVLLSDLRKQLLQQGKSVPRWLHSPGRKA